MHDTTITSALNSDEHAVALELDNAAREQRVIGDGAARTIAAWFHSATDPGLMGLSSSGAINLTDLRRDITYTEEMLDDDDSFHKKALRALRAYANHHGNRGRQDGWAGVWVR